MANKEGFHVIWSEQSLHDALHIKDYLLDAFSNKEVDDFYQLLDAFENTVKHFPTLYPDSPSNIHLKKAVLSSVVSVVYEVTVDEIVVISILDNRSSHPHWR